MQLQTHGILPCTSGSTDALTVTFISNAGADAGPDADVVAGQPVNLVGVVEDASTYHWITAGDGTFNNIALLNAVYTPGANDISNGEVILGLVAQSVLPCTMITTDYITVNIFPDALLAVKFFVEGLYSGNGSMIPSLFLSGATGNPNLADSCTIKLHNASSPYSVVFSSVTTLSTSGVAIISVPASMAGGNFYVSLHHRNGLETWSKNPTTISAFGLLDFSR